MISYCMKIFYQFINHKQMKTLSFRSFFRMSNFFPSLSKKTLQNSNQTAKRPETTQRQNNPNGNKKISKDYEKTIHYLSPAQIRQKINRMTTVQQLTQFYKHHSFTFSRENILQYLRKIKSCKKSFKESQMIEQQMMQIDWNSLGPESLSLATNLAKEDQIENLVINSYNGGRAVKELWALSKIQSKNLPLISDIIFQIQQEFQSEVPAPQEIALVFWSMGRLKIKDKGMLSQLIPCLWQNQFNGRQLVMILMGIKHLNISLKQYEKFTEKQIQQLNFNEESVLTLRTLIILIGAFNQQKSMISIAKNILQRNEKLSIKFCSNICFALAKNDLYDDKIFKQLSYTLLDHLKDGQIIDLSQCFIAYLFALKHNKKYTIVLDSICKRLFLIRKKLNVKSKKLIQDQYQKSQYKNEALDFILQQ